MGTDDITTAGWLLLEPGHARGQPVWVQARGVAAAFQDDSGTWHATTTCGGWHPRRVLDQADAPPWRNAAA